MFQEKLHRAISLFPHVLHLVIFAVWSTALSLRFFTVVVGFCGQVLVCHLRGHAGRQVGLGLFVRQLVLVARHKWIDIRARPRIVSCGGLLVFLVLSSRPRRSWNTLGRPWRRSSRYLVCSNWATPFGVEAGLVTRMLLRNWLSSTFKNLSLNLHYRNK